MSNKPYFLNPILYQKIVQTVEDALNDDFNMIIEEFDFYRKISPKMQTMVIKEIFAKFMSDFDHFLGSWEEGFKNEFIVNLFTRKYKEYETFVNAGHELESIILITGGCAHCLSKEDYMFMILPKYSVYGDYNAAFNIKTLIAVQGPPNPPNLKPVTLSSGQKEYFTCFTMNCEVEIFQDLMELYPETSENIQIRALEKREVYMYYL